MDNLAKLKSFKNHLASGSHPGKRCSGWCKEFGYFCEVIRDLESKK